MTLNKDFASNFFNEEREEEKSEDSSRSNKKVKQRSRLRVLERPKGQRCPPPPPLRLSRVATRVGVVSKLQNLTPTNFSGHSRHSDLLPKI